ncbi:hypothetical protein JTB14_004710 [Gonioctena quinquepunctata]|nr:hypothetical protein JTB14_004710 [Gonioctena quinquepunctata]
MYGITSIKSLPSSLEKDIDCRTPQYPHGNKWVYKRDGLSSSAWINAVKMSTDVAPVIAIPGRSINGRHCSSPDGNGIETSAHVLGNCRKGNLRDITEWKD